MNLFALGFIAATLLIGGWIAWFFIDWFRNNRR